jgi:tRNA 2-thiocytidine biosynthesis protein TtcA
VGKAIGDYGMIAQGDRVMVCLSGGKDSYTLLDMLLSLQRSAPVSFELIAVNLDQKQPGFPAEVLPRYLTELGVPFHIIEQNTYAVVKRVIPEGKTMCGLCSRLRRGALYRLRRRERHHQDRARASPRRHRRDPVPEHVFRRPLKAMPPKLLSENRRHIVIRPLAYVAERDRSPVRRPREFPSFPAPCAGRRPNMQRRGGQEHAARLGAEVPRPRRVDFFQHLQRRAARSSRTRRCSILRDSRGGGRWLPMTEADEAALEMQLDDIEPAGRGALNLAGIQCPNPPQLAGGARRSTPGKPCPTSSCSACDFAT